MAPVSADSKANSLITKVKRDRQGGFLSKYSVVQRSEIKWAYLFIAPQMIGLAIFTLGPILYAGYLSFTKWNLFKPPQWVGLENYIDQLQDPTFGNLLRNTFLITAGYIPLVMIVSLAMALALNQKLRFTVILPPGIFHAGRDVAGGDCLGVALGTATGFRLGKLFAWLNWHRGTDLVGVVLNGLSRV